MSEVIDNTPQSILENYFFSNLDAEELKKIKVPEGYTLVHAAETYDRIETAIDAAIEATKIKLGKHSLQFGFGGLIVGAGLGGAVAYFVTRGKLETKYNKIADDEIAEMQQHYRDKTVALENTVAKPGLEAIVREQGYSTEPPMAVTPPSAVVDAAKEAEEAIDPRPEPEVAEENVFEKPPVTPGEVGMPLVRDDWDWHKERVSRSPIRPYVIHRDEMDDSEAYDSITYTYYEEDDVLCNERDEVVGKDERDALVGERNLERFGHGSGDASIVFIRNDRLEMQMEVVRSPNSFAEEVHGFQHSEHRAMRYHRERTSSDDE